MLLRALDVRVHPTGLENLPTSGAVILAANHVAYPDFVFIEKAAHLRGRFIRFLTRYDVWRPGPIAWAMDAMGLSPSTAGSLPRRTCTPGGCCAPERRSGSSPRPGSATPTRCVH